MPNNNSIFPSPFSMPEPNASYRFPKDPYTAIPGKTSSPPYIKAMKGVQVTAYGYGKDNAYKDNPDGGANIAYDVDPSRPKVNYNPQAHLGIGSFDDPSTAAVHPKSGIPIASLTYIPDKGWFRVEDHFAASLPLNRIDMWSGKSTSDERSALTPGPTDLTIYWPNTPIPLAEQRKGPSGQWLRHYAKMKDREPH